MNGMLLFQNKLYAQGTVVKIYEKYKEKFKFNSYIVFVKYDSQNKLYCFTSLHNSWDTFHIPQDQLYVYIECIFAPCFTNKLETCSKAKPQYIEGIVSAWIWYILIMVFALFLAGVENVIMVWILASVVFFNWRRRKINGE